MEEVNGSNPFRSTKTFHTLTVPPISRLYTCPPPQAVPGTALEDPMVVAIVLLEAFFL